MAGRGKKTGGPDEPACYMQTICYESSGPLPAARELRQLARQMRLLEQQVKEPAMLPETLRFALTGFEWQCQALRVPAYGRMLTPNEERRLDALLARVQKAVAALAGR